jgi:hypothetical protein
MGEITGNDLELAYQKLCKILKYEEGSWLSIFAFSALMGHYILSSKSLENAEYRQNITTKITSINGPHGETVLKAHKLYQQRLTCRIKTAIKLPLHGCYILYLVIKDRLGLIP